MTITSNQNGTVLIVDDAFANIEILDIMLHLPQLKEDWHGICNVPIGGQARCHRTYAISQRSLMVVYDGSKGRGWGEMIPEGLFNHSQEGVNG